MEDNIKVVNVIHRPPPYEYNADEARPDINWETNNGQWVGIWPYEWADVLGFELLKITDRLDYEVWQPDPRADKIYSHQFENGLIHRLFPAKSKAYLMGLKMKRDFYSAAMSDKLDEVSDNNTKVVLHLNANYSYSTRHLLNKYFGKMPIISQFYSDFTYQFEENTTKYLLKKLHNQIKKSMIRDYFSKVQNILTCKDGGTNLIKQNTNADIYKVAWGIDFDTWTNDKDKIKAREILDIPPDKFVILSSSRLNSHKQVHRLIEVLGHISHLDFLLCISGHGTQEYEHELKSLVQSLNMQNKVILIGYVDVNTLKDYYLSSDLFISTSLSEMGPESSLLAMALEIPVMTTNTGLACEILNDNNAGIVLPVQDYKTWEIELERVISGKNINTVDRQKIIEFFTWDRIARNYINIYENVAQAFYEEKI